MKRVLIALALAFGLVSLNVGCGDAPKPTTAAKKVEPTTK